MKPEGHVLLQLPQVAAVACTFVSHPSSVPVAGRVQFPNPGAQ